MGSTVEQVPSRPLSTHVTQDSGVFTPQPQLHYPGHTPFSTWKGGPGGSQDPDSPVLLGALRAEYTPLHSPPPPTGLPCCPLTLCFLPASVLPSNGGLSSIDLSAEVLPPFFPSFPKADHGSNAKSLGRAADLSSVGQALNLLFAVDCSAPEPTLSPGFQDFSQVAGDFNKPSVSGTPCFRDLLSLTRLLPFPAAFFRNFNLRSPVRTNRISHFISLKVPQ